MYLTRSIHCLIIRYFCPQDELQFVYQEGVSGTICTWLALETITHFLNNGSEVLTCVMDMTKAFDNMKHSVLLNKLM